MTEKINYSYSGRYTEVQGLNIAFNSKIGKAGLYPTFLSFLSFPDILQLRNSATLKLAL